MKGLHIVHAYVYLKNYKREYNKTFIAASKNPKYIPKNTIKEDPYYDIYLVPHLTINFIKVDNLFA